MLIKFKDQRLGLFFLFLSLLDIIVTLFLIDIKVLAKGYLQVPFSRSHE